MKKALPYLIVIALIAIISIAWYYLIYKPSQMVPDGTPCKIGGKIPGTMKSGTCIPKIAQEEVSL